VHGSVGPSSVESHIADGRHLHFAADYAVEVFSSTTVDPEAQYVEERRRGILKWVRLGDIHRGVFKDPGRGLGELPQNEQGKHRCCFWKPW